jgi:hypothetical protein
MQIFDITTQEGRDSIAEFEKRRVKLAGKGQQLYAQIKRSSKYYGQTVAKALFPVYVEARRGEYVVQGGPGGQYRLADVNLFVAGEDGETQRIS